MQMFENTLKFSRKQSQRNKILMSLIILYSSALVSLILNHFLSRKRDLIQLWTLACILGDGFI